MYSFTNRTFDFIIYEINVHRICQNIASSSRSLQTVSVTRDMKINEFVLNFALIILLFAQRFLCRVLRSMLCY